MAGIRHPESKRINRLWGKRPPRWKGTKRYPEFLYFNTPTGWWSRDGVLISASGPWHWIYIQHDQPFIRQSMDACLTCFDVGYESYPARFYWTDGDTGREYVDGYARKTGKMGFGFMDCEYCVGWRNPPGYERLGSFEKVRQNV